MNAHVLYVSDVYFPRVNGVSTSIGTFRADLAATGVQTTLVAPDYGAAAIGAAAEEGVIRVRSRPVPRDPEDRLMNWGALRTALRAVPARPYDLVHIHTPFIAHYAAVRAAKHWNIPVVATCHTYFEDYLHHYLPVLPHVAGRWLARRFTTSQFRQVDAVVSPSQMLADKLADYGVTTPVTVIPTGMPESRFVRGDGARFRAAHGIAADRPLVLIVGRIAHEKNLRFLLRMFARLRTLHAGALLVMAGEGPARESLMAEGAALGLGDDVCYVGNLDRERGLNDCYAAADVFVFASRTETQGLVLLEAMAQARPVVSTACLGTRSVLAEGCGAVVVDEDEAGFATAVAALLADPARARGVGERGESWARSWSSRGMAQRTAALYGEILSRPKSTPGRTVAPMPESAG